MLADVEGVVAGARMFLFPWISGDAALILCWAARLPFAASSCLLLSLNGDAGDDIAFVHTFKILSLMLCLDSWQEERL